jgi:hypothetical protein
MLVAMTAPRLRALGFDVPERGGERPSHRLYELLSESDGDAHSRDNALVARIVSFSLYLTGGATAVLPGWRESTLDVDIRLEPVADELLRELSSIKGRVGVNVELASPPDFIPELPACDCPRRPRPRRDSRPA